MKILVVHNTYQQPGGEDGVVAQEIQLLRDAGHQVVTYSRSNHEISEAGLPGKLALPVRFIWAQDAVRDLHDLIRRERPDIAHFHNTHFMISPAAYSACAAMQVPVVQTLHNFRLLCPNAQFFRNGHACEDCLNHTPPLPGIVHACYRASRAQTAMVAASITVHRWLRTWQERVAVYIALTEFGRQKFVQGGLPTNKVVVKPNSVYPDPGCGATSDGSARYALFVGRLSAEKGVATLLSAWEQVGTRLPLKIVGDGPLSALAAEASRRLPGVEWSGHRSKADVLALMKNADMLIVPSIWYETFPLVIVEAYASGLPVLASDLGSLSSLIIPNRTGLHFLPGDPGDLAAKIGWLLEHPAEWAAMRAGARAEFETNYTADHNYRRLMDIYEMALATNAQRVTP